MSSWLLYYQLFTNYAGIGFIEAVGMITILLMEIPTRALADLIGKKNTLIAGLFARTIGQFVMASAQSFIFLPISVFIIGFGYALQSGAFEALIYDSLKDEGKEKAFNKVIANTSSIGLISSAIASILGGYLYTISPNLPYIFTALSLIVATTAAFFLKEPHTDSEKFSWTAYKQQTIKGFKHLFDPKFKKITTSILAVSFLLTIMYEFGADAFIFNLNLTEKQLGIYFAILFLSTAIASQATPFIHKILKTKKTLIFSTFLYGLILIITSQIIHPYLAAGIFLLSAWIFRTIVNTRSKILNDNTQSNLRATTLSTFSMLIMIPYALIAIGIGKIIDIITPNKFVMIMGILTIIASFIQINILKTKIKHS